MKKRFIDRITAPSHDGFNTPGLTRGVNVDNKGMRIQEQVFDHMTSDQFLEFLKSVQATNSFRVFAEQVHKELLRKELKGLTPHRCPHIESLSDERQGGSKISKVQQILRT